MKKLVEQLNESLVVTESIINENNKQFISQLFDLMSKENESKVIDFLKKQSIEKDMFKDSSDMVYEYFPHGGGFYIYFQEIDGRFNARMSKYEDEKDYVVVYYDFWCPSKWDEYGKLEISVPEFDEITETIRKRINKAKYNKFLKQLESLGMTKVGIKYGKHCFEYVPV